MRASAPPFGSAAWRKIHDGVFAAYLTEFLLVNAAGTGVFLVLTVTSFLDLIAGFTVTIGSRPGGISSSTVRNGVAATDLRVRPTPDDGPLGGEFGQRLAPGLGGGRARSDAPPRGFGGTE